MKPARFFSSSFMYLNVFFSHLEQYSQLFQVECEHKQIFYSFFLCSWFYFPFHLLLFLRLTILTFEVQRLLINHTILLLFYLNLLLIYKLFCLLKAYEAASKVVKDEEAIKQSLCDDLNSLVQISFSKTSHGNYIFLIERHSNLNLF